MQHESSQSGSTAAAPVQPVFALTGREREPPFFSGLRGDDVEDWLDQFNRVSAFNRWDDRFKLQIVSFSLIEAAKTWFRNNEKDMSDWAYLVSELRRIFGTSSNRSDEAKRQLAVRVQLPNEAYASYIEDVIALCRRADSNMSETDQVQHIMKGIAPFAFNALVVQNPTTIADVRTICQRLDHLQSIHLQHDCTRSCSLPDSELRTLIRTIIREELQQRDTTCSQNTPVQARGLRDLIKEELACMTDVPQPCCPAPTHVHSYSEAVTRPSQPMERIPPPTTHGHLTAISAPSPSPPPFPAWRPPRPASERPVCYYCGIRGHISRFCRRRQLDERRGYAPYERDAYFGYAPRQRLYSPPPRQPSPVHDARSFPRDSRPTRRRSPSPFRRALSPLRPVSNSNVPNQHQEN